MAVSYLFLKNQLQWRLVNSTFSINPLQSHTMKFHLQFTSLGVSSSPSMASLSFSFLFSFNHLFYTTAAAALLLTLPVFFFIFFFFSRNSNSKQSKSPPGPPGWPVVGNLFQFALSGKQFIHYVRDLAPKYGPIFTLKMGTRSMYIVTCPDLAHKALVENGIVFADRPSENPTRSIFSANKFTINSASYGPVWRSLRRNLVYEMLSSTRLKGFRDVRVLAMDRLINRFKTEAESSSSDGLVWVLKNVRFAVFTILILMCFGVEMDEETIDKIDQISKLVLITISPRLDDFLPILGPFFRKQRKRVGEVRKLQLETFVPFIQQRRLAVQNPGSDTTAAKFSYLDTLFDLKIEGRQSSTSDAELVTLCSEFLNGGTDTTATAVEWAIARLIQNPLMQSKLYEEIKSTVGDRKVDENDIQQMEYLNAFTKELLRKHPPTYFVLTHSVTQPTKLGGYDIPVDVNVEFFVPAMAGNPKHWSDPDNFDPDRFLSGKEDADITGNKEVKMMPFGVGRRICPGLGMGTLHVNLIIARMVQEFEWSAPPDQRTIDMSEKLEFTVVMKNPLQAVIKPRA